ncbi:MAG: metallophosphoesterase family protein [Bacilli bacterium]|nr:metallophosphoesterase family protein [Bacilli bacterium]
MKKLVNKLLPISVIGLMSAGLCLSMRMPSLQVAYAGEIGDYGDATRLQSMSFYGDTRTQMGFCWTTSNYTQSVLQVIEQDKYDASNGFDDPSISTQIKYFDGTIEPSQISDDGFIHRAVATGLKPDTRYAYRFGDEDLARWCEVGSFKTSANSNRNFSFLHISDPQGDNELHYESYNQLLGDMQQFNPEWIALTGDIADDSHFGGTIDLHEWELALTNQWSILKNYPVNAVSGNHDGAINAFHARYTNDVPAGSDSSTGDYYSFDYQGVHFTCLNSNDTPNPKDPNTTGMRETQLAWAEADLAAHKDDKFLIVMMHKGLFDAGGHSCNDDHSDYDIEQMRRQLAPLFTKYGVDLVLEGHDHLYNLSYPMVADEYVGQDHYYYIDSDYKYSYRTYGDLENVYTFSNLKGTFYFNTGTATGQKYYAPVIGGSMQDTIFDTSNPNQKMFTMVDILDNSILLRTYTCTSNETKLYKVYAIANDSEGESAGGGSSHENDFVIEGNYSFNYQFSRYGHSAKVKMSTVKLINAEADLAAKFVGEFTCDGGEGQSILQLYRTGKIVMTNKLVIEGEAPIEFITSGSWYMEGKELIMTILDEKEANVIYRVKPSGGTNLGLVLGLSIGIPVLVAGIAVGVFFIIKKKKKEQK